MKKLTHPTVRMLTVAVTLILLALARPAAPHAHAQQTGPTLRGSTIGVYGPVIESQGVCKSGGR